MLEVREGEDVCLNLACLKPRAQTEIAYGLITGPQHYSYKAIAEVGNVSNTPIQEMSKFCDILTFKRWTFETVVACVGHSLFKSPLLVWV
jgi:hypothetical protein